MKHTYEPLPGLPSYDYCSGQGYDALLDIFNGLQQPDLLYVKPDIDKESPNELTFFVCFGNTRIVEFGSRKSAEAALARIVQAAEDEQHLQAA